MELVFPLFCLLAAAIVQAQKVELYCVMAAMNKLFSRKVTIDINYVGRAQAFFF